jgi:hypothetical protein
MEAIFAKQFALRVPLGIKHRVKDIDEIAAPPKLNILVNQPVCHTDAIDNVEARRTGFDRDECKFNTAQVAIDFGCERTEK